MYYISYFYNIRFFPTNLIPLSTAAWDPKWFHDFKGKDHTFVDKRGIINGLRIEQLSPEGIYDATEDCKKGCEHKPDSCAFLKKYRAMLDNISFKGFITYLNLIAGKLGPDAEVCLIVYEKPDNPCSERQPLKQWFKDNGMELVEWESHDV